MNKRDALRLKPDTRLICCKTQGRYLGGQWWSGRVVRVTPNGGVLVRIIEGKCPSRDWCGPGTGPNAGEEMWFSYHEVNRNP